MDMRYSIEAVCSFASGMLLTSGPWRLWKDVIVNLNEVILGPAGWERMGQQKNGTWKDVNSLVLPGWRLDDDERGPRILRYGCFMNRKNDTTKKRKADYTNKQPCDSCVVAAALKEREMSSGTYINVLDIS